MNAAILCGGRGSRLSPLTDVLPKSLIEVAGRPFIFSQLDLLRDANVHRILLCVGYLGSMIQDAVGSEYRGISINYIFDGVKPLGTAGALRKALPLLGNSFYVLYGDAYVDCDYAEVARSFWFDQKPILITIAKNEHSIFANNVLMDGMRLVTYNKDRPLSMMKHIDYGLAVMSPAGVLSGNWYDLSELYRHWSARGRVAVYEIKRKVYNIGTHAGLIDVRQYLEDGH